VKVGGAWWCWVVLGGAEQWAVAPQQTELTKS